MLNWDIGGRWLKLATRYTTWQALALMLNVAGGFALVRLLSVEEYARFSIVLAILTAGVTVADSGICNTLNARAAGASGNAHVLGQLMAAARGMALRRTPWVIAAGAIASWLLLDGHGSAGFALLAAALVAVYIGVAMTRMLWHVMARLKCSIMRVLQIDTSLECARPMLTVAVVWVWPAAAPALLVAVAIAVAHWVAYRRLVAPLLGSGVAAPSNDGDFRATTRQVLPVTVFFVFQGQVALWILAGVGTVADVAALGAIGRFAAIYSLAGPFIANVLSPRLAAIADSAHLRARVRQIFAVALLIAVGVTAASVVLADHALALLGPAYRGLGLEFLVLMALSGVGFVTSMLNAINVARAWVTHYWLTIPATLLGQVLVVALIDVSTLRGALVLSAVTVGAQLAVYGFICARGMAQFHRSNRPPSIAS